MFRIKICGLTRTEDARLLARLPVDAVGLNFFADSPRCVPLDTARRLAELLPPAMLRVGVFVNATSETLRQATSAVPLDVAQLHGDEPPEQLAELGDLVLVRAMRLRPEGAGDVCRYVEQVERRGGRLAALLLDASGRGVYGGSGETADWNAAKTVVENLAPLPVILAGGLTADNVAQAVAAVRPYGVDVASGVETAPGAKDAAQLEQFVSRARRALGLRDMSRPHQR